MTLYGFSRKDVTRQLSDFAKKDLISGYPTEEVLQHGLGEFQQGRQTAADMELYAFISPEDIPAAVAEFDDGGQVRMQASVSPERCKIYKPYPRSRDRKSVAREPQRDSTTVMLHTTSITHLHKQSLQTRSHSVLFSVVCSSQ